MTDVVSAVGSAVIGVIAAGVVIALICVVSDMVRRKR